MSKIYCCNFDTYVHYTIFQFITCVENVCLFSFGFFSWVYQLLSDSYDLRINTGLILGLCPANETWRYFVTTSLIGSVQA